MNNLLINGVEVRERGGLYCLNDIHKASGGSAAKKIREWLKLASTIKLIAYLSGMEFHPGKNCCCIQRVQEGRSLNTYADKVIVYSYAMWVDVSFHVAVIEAFDALVNGEIETARKIAKATVIKADALDKMCDKASKLTITQACAEIYTLTGIAFSPQRLNALLKDGAYKLPHWYNNNGGGWCKWVVERGYAAYKYNIDPGGNKHRLCVLTSRGSQYVAEYLNRYYMSHPLKK